MRKACQRRPLLPLRRRSCAKASLGSASAAADAGFDLQLSGHTHGGQFWPWMHFVKFQQPFTAGLNKLKDL